MKFRHSIAVILPAFALAVLVLQSTRESAPDSIPEPVISDSNPAPVGDTELPDWVRKPPPYLESDLEPLRDEAEILNIAATATSINAEIMKEVRRSVFEDPNFRRRDGVSDPLGSDTALPQVPALPGVSGFKIRECAAGQKCLHEYLAQEPDNPSWARTMEGRIYGAMANRFSHGVSQVHVVCRQATCGLLIPMPPGDNPLGTLMMARALADELGFVGYSAAGRSDFQAMYFTQSEEKAPPAIFQ